MNITKLLIGTGNRGKVREFADAFAETEIGIVGLESLAPAPPEPEETGDTFEANARIKAEAYSMAGELPTVADDSGLEVDALGGAPGVLSARYGGPGLDDKGRNRALLQAMAQVTEPELRTARFRCCLALAFRGETLAVFDGSVEGRLLHEERGAGGFGYDPLFYYPPFESTLAEVTTERKRTVSHRGKAIALLLEALREGKLALMQRSSRGA